MATYKVNISLAPQLVDEIDAAAKELGLTRSGFVAEASARYVADVRNLDAEERRRRDIDRAIASFKRVGAKLSAQDIQDMMDQTRRDRDRGWRGETEW
jgi:metal-responsive CopG/Arc/MetJ family transcriptional regulator